MSTGHNDIGYRVNAASKLLRSRMAQEAAAHDLTAQQAAVLLTLSLSGETEPTITAIATHMGMDRPTMTGVVDRLIRDGWVFTVPNPADGRSKLLRPTKCSRSVTPLLAEASGRIGLEAVGGLQRGEIDTLGRLLDTVIANLGDAPHTEAGRS
ncbi:MAG: MarR family transcriptional regulator [Actinomycetota bacterium]|nr:MarR family transcriptional regulator [Actinomycetota bacterium]